MKSPLSAVIARLGEEVTLAIKANGTNPTYQWLKEADCLRDSEAVKGATCNTLVLKKLTSDASGVYSCRVSNGISCQEISTTLDIGVLLHVRMHVLLTTHVATTWVLLQFCSSTYTHSIVRLKSYCVHCTQALYFQ